jgi:hypothetical protein
MYQKAFRWGIAGAAVVGRPVDYNDVLRHARESSIEEQPPLRRVGRPSGNPRKNQVHNSFVIEWLQLYGTHSASDKNYQEKSHKKPKIVETDHNTTHTIATPSTIPRPPGRSTKELINDLSTASSQTKKRKAATPTPKKKRPIVAVIDLDDIASAEEIEAAKGLVASTDCTSEHTRSHPYLGSRRAPNRPAVIQAEYREEDKENIDPIVFYSTRSTPSGTDRASERSEPSLPAPEETTNVAPDEFTQMYSQAAPAPQDAFYYVNPAPYHWYRDNSAGASFGSEWEGQDQSQPAYGLTNFANPQSFYSTAHPNLQDPAPFRPAFLSSPPKTMDLQTQSIAFIHHDQTIYQCLPDFTESVEESIHGSDFANFDQTEASPVERDFLISPDSPVRLMSNSELIAQNGNDIFRIRADNPYDPEANWLEHHQLELVEQELESLYNSRS